MGGVVGKHGSFLLDHSMDDVFLRELKADSLKHSPVSTITGGDQPPPYKDDPSRLLETPADRKARKISHWVAYSTMFVMNMGFSVVLSGVWPYLHEELAPDLSKTSLGWVVAANPFGQMLASPLIGLWGKKSGSIRLPCLSSIVFFILGNIMYSLLSNFIKMGAKAPYYAMIVSRFIVGVSSVLQTVMTVAIPDEVDTGIDWLRWNKYTATGWTAAALGLINLVLLMPCVFKEYNIAEKERGLYKSAESNIKLPSPDYLGICGALLSFFIVMFIYVLLETLAVPFVMDQYAWSENQAMVVVGIGLSIGGLLTVAMYAVSGVLVKKYNEKKVMFILGFIPMIVGTFLFLPWGDNYLKMEKCYTDDNSNVTAMTGFTTGTTIETNSFYLSDTFLVHSQQEDKNCSLGCPEIQTWCAHTPVLPQAQLAVAFTLDLLGFPVAQAIIQALFSKMLGPKPQGVWMGVLTGVGSLSRIMGPVFVSYIYTYYGTRWCFSILTVAIILAMAELSLLYKRLIPMKIPHRNGQVNNNGSVRNEHTREQAF
ncbi:major facilitator superfamily domain-containing protein 8 isoform X2 [Cherax quadricarinatus]|uniref:major facilitator superfamily domain-containing protein 8 isoform X2 n=1 Tax=Cherax quadricarinatus TaxID=27406 RepID=UPI00387ECE6B